MSTHHAPRSVRSSTTFFASLALALLVSAGAASAQNLLVNGDFELGSQATVTVTENTTVLPGWSVQAASGDSVIGVALGGGLNEPNAVDGTHLLSIGGFGSTKGSLGLWQDFTTRIGQQYAVSIYFGRGNNDSDVSGNPVGMGIAALNVIDGTPAGPLYVGRSGLAPATGATSDLIQSNFTFTATGDTSRLLFVDLTDSDSANNLYLDAASVSAVPEPSCFATIAGVAMLGFGAARRRRRIGAGDA